MATSKKAPERAKGKAVSRKAQRAKAGKASGAELCYGCGDAAKPGQIDLTQRRVIVEAQHPVIGVINERDVDDSFGHVVENPTEDTGPDGEFYVGVPVCRACHVDPQHRRLRPLKCHFFERVGNTHKMALIAAGSSDIGG